MARFVGRSASLDAVGTGISAALAGNGPVVVVSGEAGIGKTALVGEVTGRRNGADVVWGGAVLDEWQPAFGPWAEIVRGVVAALGRDRALAAAGPGADLLAQLAPELGTGPARRQVGDQARAQLLDSLGALLVAAAATRPLVVVIDDLQWAEPDALLATRVVGRRLPCPGLAVVTTVRDPDPDHSPADAVALTLDALARRPGVLRVELTGLGDADIAELARAFGDFALPAGVAAAIRAGTEGNPLYATEVIRHLVEERTLELRDGRWASDISTAELALPRGVRDLVARRVRRCNPLARELLAVAAVLGGDLGFPLAQRLLDAPEPAVLDALDEVIAAGFLRPNPEGTGYRFRHAVLRSALAGAHNPDRKRAVHLRVAAALEQLHTADPDRAAGELAFQYHAAGVAEPGVARCITAAEQSTRAQAHRAAARYLRMALDLLAADAPPVRRARVQAELAVALADALNLDEAGLAAAEAADALTRAGAGENECADLLTAVAHRLKQGGAPSALWRPLVDRGLKLLADRHDLRWARLRLLVDPIEAEVSGRVRTGRWLGHDPDVLEVLRREGTELDVAGGVEAWDWRDRAGLEQLLDQARTAVDPAAELRYLEIAGRGYAFRLGDLAAAIGVYRQLRDAAAAVGSIMARAEAFGHLAICGALLGDLDGSARAQAQLIELTRRLGDDHRLRRLAATTDTLHHYLGCTEPDRAVTDALIEQAGSVPNGQTPPGWIAAGFAALRLAMHGDRDGVAALLDDLLVLCEAAEPRRYVLGGTLWVSATAIWECRLERYAARVVALLDRLEQAGVPLGPIRSRALCRGWMQELTGDVAAARASFATGRSDFAQSGHRPFLAMTDHSEAVALRRWEPGRVDEVAALAAGAASRFTALGMAGWARRAAAAGESATEPPPGPPPGPPPESPVRATLPITRREQDVLALVVRGLTNNEIAGALHLSVATVERHLANLYPKIGARNRAHATAIATASRMDAHPG